MATAAQPEGREGPEGGGTATRAPGPEADQGEDAERDDVDVLENVGQSLHGNQRVELWPSGPKAPTTWEM
jgi:hypothetical protein